MQVPSQDEWTQFFRINTNITLEKEKKTEGQIALTMPWDLYCTIGKSEELPQIPKVSFFEKFLTGLGSFVIMGVCWNFLNDNKKNQAPKNTSNEKVWALVCGRFGIEMYRQSIKHQKQANLVKWRKENRNLYMRLLLKKYFVIPNGSNDNDGTNAVQLMLHQSSGSLDRPNNEAVALDNMARHFGYQMTAPLCFTQHATPQPASTS